MEFRLQHFLFGLYAATLLCSVQSARAADNAREFAGMYEISDVAKSGGTVQLTITFTLLNPTDKVVNDGVITVLASSPAPKTLGRFGVIETLPRIGRVRVTETFKISAAEYARWETGSLPHFEFTAPGESGPTAAGIQARRVPNNIGTGGT